tara:strand:+ start:479 stop:943 length:465 start_codon:yes stop_codon:yes gene_type:complete
MESLRKGIGIFLLNSKKQLWIGKRIDVKNDYWQMPQGGIDNNESPLQAMKREMKEETGITENFNVITESKEWLSYELPKDLVNAVWGGKYLGQKQKWFACNFFGKDDEIKLDKHKPEFMDWKWIKPDNVLDLVVPFKRKMYEKILRNFESLYQE